MLFKKLLISMWFVVFSFALFLPPTLAFGEYSLVETFDVGSGVYVRALKLDRAANSMWVGTSTGVMEIDLAKLAPRNTFTRDDGLANEYVFGIGIDAKGHKWFGTNAGGVSRYKDGQWKTFFPMHGLADYWVYCFANDKRGDVWIGTWAGANRYDLKTGKFTTYVKELVNEWVYGIDVDGQGRVWFGTEGGVSMFDGRIWKSWTHADGLGAKNESKLPASSNTGLGTRNRHDLTTLVSGGQSYNPSYVFSLVVDRRGDIWAGTWGAGVSRFDGNAWKNYTTTEGLSGNVVFSILQATDGAMWFGTNAGVTRYDGSAWERIDRRQGLLDNNVYALAEAPNGDIWVGTRGGVSRIGKNAPKK